MKALLVVLFVCEQVTGKDNVDLERLIIYGTGKWELKIKSVTQRLSGVLNNFKIQTEKTNGGIAVDYKGDQIFFAEGRNIYRIYLVDSNGQDLISNAGKLFLDKRANHFEVLLYNARKDIAGIFYDKITSKLYAAADTDLIELNSTTGRVIDSQYVGYHRNVRNPFMFNGVMYVFLHSETYYGYTWGIYENKKRYYGPLVYGHGEHITRFTIDVASSKLFLHVRSTIRMIELTANQSIHIESPHIVLGDSRYTMGLESIAAYNEYVIWSSKNLQKLYFGVMDQKTNFISVKDVEVFDSDVSSEHLCIFVREDGEKKKEGDIQD